MTPGRLRPVLLPALLAAATATAPVPEAGARFVRAGDAPATAGPALRRLARDLGEEVAASRRALEGGDVPEEGGATQEEEKEEEEGGADAPPEPRRPSSDGWERVYQGGPLYDEATGKPLLATAGEGDGEEGGAAPAERPANRRSHAAAVYRAGGDDDGGRAREWMIVSGGFTDEDWSSFPVWAYDLTHGRTIAEVEGDVAAAAAAGRAGDGAAFLAAKARVDRDFFGAPRWVDLTPRAGGGRAAVGEEDGAEDGAANPFLDAPQGRVGHLSGVHGDCLYVFGGLTYRLGSFHVDYYGAEAATDGGDEDGAGGRGGDLAIWKACGLDELLATDDEDKQGGGAEGGDADSDEGMVRTKGLRWERVVAKVDARMPTDPEEEEVEEEEEQEKEEKEAEQQQEAEFEEEAEERHTGPSSGEQDPGSRHQEDEAGANGGPARARHARSTLSLEAADAAYTLPRGEAQGGGYDPARSGAAGGPCFVFHGGMHHRAGGATAGRAAPQATTILGDVWHFDYGTATLRRLSPYPPLPWQRDTRTGTYPTARTAHAATVTGHRLILHGGMHFDSSEDQDSSTSSRGSSPFSSPSGTYATYKTSSRWQPLSDVWEFNLHTLRWKHRWQSTVLARSYHSMVGYDGEEGRKEPDGTVVAFGGYQQDNNIPGETVAFVFKDLLLSRPNETYWQKLLPPVDNDRNGQGGMSPHWRTSSEYAARASITNRLEHTAVVDEYGSMYVWGGRFQTVSQIVGLWRLDVFTKDARLSYEVAPADGIEEYEAELQALHMFIATMMFMSLTISSLFSMIRRQGGDAEGGGGGGNGGGGGGVSFMRRGLSQRVIDSLPVKRYASPPSSDTTPDCDGPTGEDSLSLRGEDDNGLAEELNLECCPICLTPFEDGVSEIRTLPCGHVFDRDCIDAWFSNHTTCPTCRQTVGDASSSGDDTENAPGGQDTRHPTRWRFHSHWNEPPPLTATDEESTRAAAVRAAIQEQQETDPQLLFISAFASRRRHRHWNNRSDDGGDTVASLDSSNSGFLGVRSFFGRRARGMTAIPGEEDGEETDANNESIELV